MKRTIFTISFLILCSVAHAEPWVCFDGTTKYVNKVVEGDGLHLGISGKDNSNIDPNCILATASEYSDAQQVYKKVDTGQAVGSRVVDWTAQEISDYEDALAAADEAAQCVSINDLDIMLKEAFVAWLQLYNSKVPAQYQVTNAEMKTQVRANRGITCP